MTAWILFILTALGNGSIEVRAERFGQYSDCVLAAQAEHAKRPGQVAAYCEREVSG